MKEAENLGNRKRSFETGCNELSCQSWYIMRLSKITTKIMKIKLLGKREMKDKYKLEDKPGRFWYCV